MNFERRLGVLRDDAVGALLVDGPYPFNSIHHSPFLMLKGAAIF